MGAAAGTPMADDEPDWKKLGGGGGVSAARNMFKQKEAEAAKDAGSPGSSRGSPGSRSAASLAVELAKGLGEAVHVFVDSKDKGRAVARFEEVRQLVGGLEIPVRETSSTLGRPDVKLVDTAREARAGLIVIGAYGRNRISDYFIGSNAASVARTSPVGVVLAR